MIMGAICRRTLLENPGFPCRLLRGSILSDWSEAEIVSKGAANAMSLGKPAPFDTHFTAPFAKPFDKLRTRLRTQFRATLRQAQDVAQDAELR